MIRKGITILRSDVGAVTAEAAIVLPTMLLVIFAGFEFARLQIVRHSADIAAYEASREVIVPGATESEGRAVANEILALVGVRNASVTVDPSTLDESVEEVSVTVNIPLAENGWILPYLSAGKSINTTATLRTERTKPLQQGP